MDKSTRNFIITLGFLFFILTSFVFLGGYAYEVRGFFKPKAEKQTQNITKDGINFQPYMDEMQSRIKKAWVPADKSKPAKIETSYKIMKNGEIKDIEIIKSDAGEENNKSVIKTLEKVSPLPPLPMGFKEDSVNVNFTFAINGK